MLRRPNLDLVRVVDVGLGETDDPIILEWAAVNGRILLTHDQATMPDFAFDRVAAGRPLPGVFVVPHYMPVRRAIDELLLIEDSSKQEEWEDSVVYLPL